MAQTPLGLSVWEPSDLYQLAQLQPQFAQEVDAAISTAAATSTAPRLLGLSATPADLAVSGVAAIASSTVSQNVGMPEGWGMSNVYVARPAAGIVTNLAVSGTPPGELAYRSGTISGSTVTWNDWQTVGNTGSREGALRLSAMRDRVGKVEVATPATVALVMDHGLTNVKSKVLPLLRARGLRATLAINSQKWTDPLNSGASQADVRGWSDVFEFANHGRNHLLTGAPGNDRKEIEQGRTELEAQLQTTVDTWVQTGNGTYPFGDGNAPEKYWTTETGRIITRTHAVYTGLVPHATKRYPIDGHPKLGAHGFWIDQTTSTAQTQITTAIAEGTGVIIRLHPQYLDQAGYLTTAQLTAFLDWLVARRDAGEVTVLPFREWSLASLARISEATLQGQVADALANEETVQEAVSTAVSGLAVIQSPTVGRIVAVPHDDPLPALADGDVVLRYILAGKNYLEDFSAMSVDAPPPGFTARWDDLTTTATVVADAGARGGKSLQLVHTTNDRQLLSWDAIDDDVDRANVEMLTRWRTDVATAHGGLAARASGGRSDETGYRGAGSNTHSMVTKYVAGVFTSMHQTSKPAPVPGTWYLTRTRVVGDQIQTRTWESGTTEPAGWQAEATDTSITAPGWVGLSFTTVGTIHFDYIAVGTAGRPVEVP